MSGRDWGDGLLLGAKVIGFAIAALLAAVGAVAWYQRRQMGD